MPRIVANDADDEHVIAAAVAARTELIVTGDRKHLLPIGSHQGIAIVTAREVVDRLAGKRQHLTKLRPYLAEYVQGADGQDEAEDNHDNRAKMIFRGRVYG